MTIQAIANALKSFARATGPSSPARMRAYDEFVEQLDALIERALTAPSDDRITVAQITSALRLRTFFLDGEKET